jgi:alkyl hydroperoxide reductase subunit AhpC
MYYDDFDFEIATVGKQAPDFKMEAVLAEGESINRFGEISLEEIKAAGK